MQKTSRYPWTKFQPDVVRAGIEEVYRLDPGERTKFDADAVRTVRIGQQTWAFDDDGEFFAEYRKPDVEFAHMYKLSSGYALSLQYEKGFESGYVETEVGVTAPSRREIERVAAIFDDAVSASQVPRVAPPKATVFIGHGRDEQWRELKDHLHEKHDYPIEAYEVGARTGHGIRDVLEAMLDRSSFAVLVMTAEDEDAAGKMHARPNVIHETGLFQGRLGFTKAMVLLEEGTSEFSNIHGINQVRFARGQIASTFGEVLATLRREFEPA